MLYQFMLQDRSIQNFVTQLTNERILVSKISNFLDNRLTDANKVVSLTRQPRFIPQKDFSNSHFCWGLSKPATSRLLA
jgi:hypothetical protein